MNTLYPLKFKPIFKDKIWGGQKIKTILNQDFEGLANCGEAWVLSGIKGDESIVLNGFLAGNNLNELVEIYMDDLIGEKNFEIYKNSFPILVKILDSNDWLSVQVHPDDVLAKKYGLDNGKNEMWYIMDAEKNAELINGFNKEINKEEFIECLNIGELKSILNYEKVLKGDVFYLPAGRIHALGPGLLLAEIQQTSDITYRIYDWDRSNINGKSRDFHIQEALEALDFKVEKKHKTSYRQVINKTCSLVQSPYFNTNLINLDQGLIKDYEPIDSFIIHLCVEGEYTLIHDDKHEHIKVGEVVLIPAMLKEIQILPRVKTKILEVYID